LKAPLALARNEQDREDLLREATALVERVELRVAGWDEPLVIGFRRSGAGSIYFGADPVYQFNDQLELRRGYLDGRLLKAENGRLVWLDRRRTATAVELIREEITADSQQKLLDRAARELDDVLRRLRESEYEMVGQVPADAPVLPRVVAWLATLSPLRVAAAPNAGR